MWEAVPSLTLDLKLIWSRPRQIRVRDLQSSRSCYSVELSIGFLMKDIHSLKSANGFTLFYCYCFSCDHAVSVLHKTVRYNLIRFYVGTCSEITSIDPGNPTDGDRNMSGPFRRASVCGCIADRRPALYQVDLHLF